jgi:16S rRNA C967 or C1407 C5-methylase (RsmB/RsmF family)
VAWTRLLKGRKVDKTVNSMGQTLFIITVQDETRTSTLTDEQKFDNILTDTGIGRLTTDQYELKEAHKMMDRKPPAQST